MSGSTCCASPDPRRKAGKLTRMRTSGVADLAGRVLAGRYRLVAPIGTGASGRVYAAWDVRLQRRVAVKVLHAALADDAGFLRRFGAEAQLAASLHHPNVVAVYRVGEVAGLITRPPKLRKNLPSCPVENVDDVIGTVRDIHELLSPIW